MDKVNKTKAKAPGTPILYSTILESKEHHYEKWDGVGFHKNLVKP